MYKSNQERDQQNLKDACVINPTQVKKAIKGEGGTEGGRKEGGTEEFLLKSGRFPQSKHRKVHKFWKVAVTIR